MVKGVAVVTISDSCFKDHSKDSSGPALAQVVQELFPQANLHTIIIPDEKELIERELKYFCDEAHVDLVLTTGGTGLSSRDMTPEATKAVIHRELPAVTIAMTLESLKKTPMAMLSRAVAGVRDQTLIINFPGSKKAVTELIEVVKPILSHAMSLIKDELTEVKALHDSMQASHSCPHHFLTSSVDVSKVALRPRESPFPMLGMEEAFQTIDEVMKQWPQIMEIVPIEHSLGRVVAQTIYAKEPMPPFPASVKDGYACLSSDGAGVRRVRSALAAGDAPTQPLSYGECARVNTGAALPCGADCVVQVEDTKLISASEDEQTELEVEIRVAPKPGQDVRPIGYDIPMGAVLAEKGDVLDAGQIAVLAGAGYQHVTAYGRPRVALLSTGNELQEPTEMKLRPAHVRDSNRIMLRMLLKEQGYSSVECGIARDSPGALATAVAGALRAADVLVASGGVSMGERDLLKPVLLKDFNATLHFGRVRMKPGKPSTFATCQFNGKTKFIFGLPGNPVSAYVCCQLFVVRALRVCTGAAPEWVRMNVRLASDVMLDPRPEYARATLRPSEDGGLPVANIIGKQCSSRLLSACGAAVLLQLPGASDSQPRLLAGAVVSALIVGRLDRPTLAL